jgi:hypothetical protein
MTTRADVAAAVKRLTDELDLDDHFGDNEAIITAADIRLVIKALATARRETAKEIAAWVGRMEPDIADRIREEWGKE